ncbi:hypothetical protein [Bradyrhizobium paxllaeri]|nr:hypothetical protein [Bradyrhizobium paxllaeri]
MSARPYGLLEAALKRDLKTVTETLIAHVKNCMEQPLATALPK